MDSIQQDFRNAMAACAAGVYLITTDGEHGRYGITMTSVAPVTDTPPTVVLCVNLNTRICPILTGNGELCINVLSADQQDAAEHFAGITKLTHEEGFEQHIWHRGSSGQLQIDDALAHLHGRILQHHDMGTHRIFYVGIEEIRLGKHNRPALAYFRRAFAQIA